eukprot:TRINITY_DN2620_c0_g2_i1.p1 TRINITY_DN2620_c0_g2~~TRINITY_DN2620_c0_g2_i1.p1  ORF type:complete len:753 (+),score=219.03 TRINITY_DN2620_c0_g2_i1:125-2383(+)
MQIANMSAAAIEAALTPTPSVSRTGKMAHSAMHTDALVRSGVAALQKKKQRKGRAPITVAEVVEPSALDSFGTADPGEDKARCKEMCSSPRGHPDLQLRMQQLMEQDRAGAFAGKMELKSPGSPRERPGSPASVRSPATKLAIKEAAAIFEQAAAGAAASPQRRVPQLQSACFRTVDRFAVSRHAQPNPPVGHYRPKFTAVDGNSAAALIRGKSPPPSPRRSPPHPRSPDSDRSPRPSYLPRDLRQKKEEEERKRVEAEAAAQRAREGDAALMGGTVAAGGDKSLAPQPPQPGQAAPGGSSGNVAEGDRAPARGADYEKWIERQKGRERWLKRGSPCFVSKLPIAAHRPTPPTVSPDKWYYPYNEVMVSKAKGQTLPANLECSRQTGRADRIMFKGHSAQSDAPAVVYDPPGDGFRARAAYKMADQVSRPKAAADAQGMSSRRHHTMNASATEVAPLHKFPASHIVYDTTADDKLKFGRADITLPWDRCVSREQRPTEVQRPRMLVDPVSPYEPSHTERTSGSKCPQTRFDKQVNRPLFLHRLPHDLEYEVSPTAKVRRVHTADLNRTVGHETLFVPSITTACNYAPNYGAVKPRSSQGPSLRKMLSRDEVRGGVPQAQMLDHFYKTDCSMNVKVQGQTEMIPLTGPRTQGNPMIQRHMSREKRQQITSVRKVSPDKFYDFDVARIRPNPDRTTLEFRRIVGREERSCGRIMPASPRQLAASPRSPGFIYDPDQSATGRHVPAARFALSSAR